MSPGSIQDEAIPLLHGGALYRACITDAPGGSHGLTILLGGSGPLDHDGRVGGTAVLKELAHGLAARGITTARVSKVAVDGAYAPMSYVDEYQAPIVALVAMLRSSGKSIMPIRLIGHSLGGHVAPLVGAGLAGIAAGVSCLVLLNAPLRNLVSVLRWQARTLGADDPEVLERTLMDGRPEMRSYLTYASTYDPVMPLAALGAPVVCVGSGRDPLLPGDELRRWNQALLSRNVVAEFRHYPGLDHFCVARPDARRSTLRQPGHVDQGLLQDLAEVIERSWGSPVPRGHVQNTVAAGTVGAVDA